MTRLKASAMQLVMRRISFNSSETGIIKLPIKNVRYLLLYAEFQWADWYLCK